MQNVRAFLFLLPLLQRQTAVSQSHGLPPNLQQLAISTEKAYWKRCQHAIQNETIIGVMITGKDAAHAKFAEQAADNFFNQTYPSKALVVINDSPLYRLAPLFNNPCLIELNATTYNPTGQLERWSLGTLRNLGLAVVPSSAVWVQWDDDGRLMCGFLLHVLQQPRSSLFSIPAGTISTLLLTLGCIDYRTPTYLAQQYAVLQSTNKPYVLLRRQLRVFLANNSSYIYETSELLRCELPSNSSNHRLLAPR
jgi:hypothetical protein